MKLDQVCLRTRHLPNPASLATYESIGGYTQLKKLLSGEIEPSFVIDSLKSSGLRGRGGAGFPTGLKWSFVSPDLPGQKYMICNADESEPGTAKDREIIRLNPHQMLEGIAIACAVLKASVGYVYFRGEFYDFFHLTESALKEAYDAGYLGKNVLNSGMDIDIYNARSGGAYICGEETALMNALEGKRGNPRFKPPFPASFGLYGRPTTINNVETFASVPMILEKSPSWFSDMGVEKSGGTKIFTVSGHVNKPGSYEIPLGLPFSELLEVAGGMLNGAKLKAVIPGGSSAPVLPAHIMMKTNMDYESIAQAGSMLGSGGLMVMDESTSMVKVLQRISRFYMHESCGQCTPCREGTGWVYRLISKIAEGKGKLADLEQLGKVAKNIEGRTICAFGEAAAWPVAGFLKHFYQEFVDHVKRHHA